MALVYTLFTLCVIDSFIHESVIGHLCGYRFFKFVFRGNRWAYMPGGPTAGFGWPGAMCPLWVPRQILRAFLLSLLSCRVALGP